jgi:hypothetical protein
VRSKLLGILAFSLIGTLRLSAQPLPSAPGPKVVLGFNDPAKAMAEPPVVELQAHSADGPYRIWVRSEYLLWWVKNSPTPALVSTGGPQDATPGAIGQPLTRILYGDSGANYGANSGFRFTLGGWLNCEQTFGFEGSGFVFERRSAGFSAASNGAGIPPLYSPVFRADLSREGVYRIADPAAGFAGGVSVNSQSRLWGAEANALANVMRRNGMSIDLLAGFRYADLAESLTIDTNSTDLVNPINDITHDRFATRNQFYGGQVGARIGLQSGRASVDLVGKVAIGVNHQFVDINGSTTESGVAGNPGTFPGGIYTQPSNLSRSAHNQFAVLPEGQVRVGYQINSHIRATVGYDYLYWNQVVRPGSQIDRSINPTQSLGGTLTGPALPAAQFNRTDYWSQGVTFGLEFRY